LPPSSAVAAGSLRSGKSSQHGKSMPA
jgi:hypothetical protein